MTDKSRPCGKKKGLLNAPTPCFHVNLPMYVLVAIQRARLVFAEIYPQSKVVVPPGRFSR